MLRKPKVGLWSGTHFLVTVALLWFGMSPDWAQTSGPANQDCESASPNGQASCQDRAARGTTAPVSPHRAAVVKNREEAPSTGEPMVASTADGPQQLELPADQASYGAPTNALTAGLQNGRWVTQGDILIDDSKLVDGVGDAEV